jgi:hypothetical protein
MYDNSSETLALLEKLLMTYSVAVVSLEVWDVDQLLMRGLCHFPAALCVVPFSWAHIPQNVPWWCAAADLVPLLVCFVGLGKAKDKVQFLWKKDKALSCCSLGIGGGLVQWGVPGPQHLRRKRLNHDGKVSLWLYMSYSLCGPLWIIT